MKRINTLSSRNLCESAKTAAAANAKLLANPQAKHPAQLQTKSVSSLKSN